MLWRSLLVGGLFAGLLGACAMVDPVDSRYDTVTRSLAKARDEAIFLNLSSCQPQLPACFYHYRQRHSDDDQHVIICVAVLQFWPAKLLTDRAPRADAVV